MADHPAPASREAGFTLIEAVTALGVFSMASIALLSIGAQNARTVTALEAHTFARIVAANELAPVVASEDRPRSGARQGETMLGDRLWPWSVAVTRTTDPDIVQITVTVTDGEDGPLAATLIGYWGTQ